MQEGRTPLHFAVADGNEAVVEVLTSYEGCSVTAYDNLFRTRNLADLFRCENLVDEAKQYLCQNFPNVASNCEDFRSLTKDELKAILSISNLWVRSEDEVFLALTKWMDSSYEERNQFMFELLSKVNV